MFVLTCDVLWFFLELTTKILNLFFLNLVSEVNACFLLFMMFGLRLKIKDLRLAVL